MYMLNTNYGCLEENIDKKQHTDMYSYYDICVFMVLGDRDCIKPLGKVTEWNNYDRTFPSLVQYRICDTPTWVPYRIS